MSELGEQLEKLIKQAIADNETKPRDMDIKDVYKLMAVIAVEAQGDPQFKSDIQEFIKIIGL